MRRFPGARTALLSGLCRIRGERRRANVDRGLVLPDHADYDALYRTVRETEASHVLTTGPHGEVWVAEVLTPGLNVEVRGDDGARASVACLEDPVEELSFL